MTIGTFACSLFGVGSLTLYFLFWRFTTKDCGTWIWSTSWPNSACRSSSISASCSVFRTSSQKVSCLLLVSPPEIRSFLCSIVMLSFHSRRIVLKYFDCRSICCHPVYWLLPRLWFRNPESCPASHLSIPSRHISLRFILCVPSETVQTTLRAHQKRQVSASVHGWILVCCSF